MWWFGTTLKTLLGVVLVDAGKILQLARHFGPWGTVLGPFGSQNVYLNALNPLAHRVIFLTCTLQIKKAELLDPLPPPLITSWSDVKQVNLGTTVILLSKIHREDSAKMESLSLYGLIEHFNVQIRESKSHPKIPRVYMNYEVIFIKGSRDPSYPLKIEVRWTPNLSLFQFEYIPHLDIFLFEMQNVIAACSTILFNNLIPIKNSYISTIIRALVMFRKETCK